ncbi:MAG: hypothetical protein E7228_04720 [Clostridiales bacterium]|nr:hypothetical protein [Clostridiales bacterium]
MRILENKSPGEKIKIYSILSIVYALVFTAGIYILIHSLGNSLDFRYEHALRMYLVFLGFSIILNVWYMTAFSEKNIKGKYSEGKRTNSVDTFIIIYRLSVGLYLIYSFRLMTRLFGDNAYGYVLSIALAFSLATFPQLAYSQQKEIFPQAYKKKSK